MKSGMPPDKVAKLLKDIQDITEKHAEEICLAINKDLASDTDRAAARTIIHRHIGPFANAVARSIIDNLAEVVEQLTPIIK